MKATVYNIFLIFLSIPSYTFFCLMLFISMAVSQGKHAASVAVGKNVPQSKNNLLTIQKLRLITKYVYS